MYQLHISTPSCMKASLPVSADVAHYLSNRLVNQEIQREELLHKIGYPVGVGSQKGSFLDSVYNFANAILKDSNASTFTVVVEAIPAHPKFNPIFKGVETFPEHGRPVVIVFKDKDVFSNVKYCKNHKEWHAQLGSLRVDKIHQWAYQDEFYESLNLPELPKGTNKPNSKALFEQLEGLLGVLSEAAVEVHLHKGSGNPLKDMFDEIFKDNPNFFKSNTKH